MIQDNLEQTWYIIGGISAMLQERPFTFDHNEFTNKELAEKLSPFNLHNELGKVKQGNPNFGAFHNNYKTIYEDFLKKSGYISHIRKEKIKKLGL